MRDYLAELAGPQYVDAILWTLAALVLLAIVLAAVKGVRAMNSGTFVAGGRARKTRLAVMDATAIDSQRRLVLVRRDDVEHLLLIGGPSDVVVEQDIRVAQQRRQAPPEPAREQAPIAVEEPAMRQLSPAAPSRQVSRPSEPPSRINTPEPARTTEHPRPTAERAPLSARPPMPPRAVQPAAVPPPSQPVRVEPRAASRSASPPVTDDLDNALLNELDLAPDDVTPRPAKGGSQAGSLDDEMARLLGELSSPKR